MSFSSTALEHLKRQILTEVTQEIKECNISNCNTLSTPDIVITSLKSHIITLESEINTAQFPADMVTFTEENT